MLQEYRYNIMNIDSMTSFAQINGGYNLGIRDVYFIRLIGYTVNLFNDIRKVDMLLTDSMRNKRVFYKRITKLPNYFSDDERQFYSRCYTDWIDNNRKIIQIKTTNNNHDFAVELSKAILSGLEAFRKTKSNINESIEKNFIIKMMWWTDYVFQSAHEFLWNKRSIIKLITQNVIKDQEVLFYYILTNIGADVLMLQVAGDTSINSEIIKNCNRIFLGDFNDITIPEYNSNLIFNQEVPKTSTIISNEYVKEKSQSKLPQITNSNVKVNTDRMIAVQNEEKDFEELAKLASSIVMISIHDSDKKIIGSGSGIMIGRDGYILTNDHVVRDGSYYSVRIEDDDNLYFTDEIIKYNTVLDLAVIRISRKLIPIPIYKGEHKLVRGQKVVAIGSPLGLFNSVSNGIISGFREIEDVDMIQFTAPISPGSSGGAVLNMQGEVIGISSAGIENGQNINLAVPYDCINIFINGFTN